MISQTLVASCADQAIEPDFSACAEADERALLRDLCDHTEALLDAGDLHAARRLNVDARTLSRRVYGAAAVTLRPNGGRRLR